MILSQIDRLMRKVDRLLSSVNNANDLIKTMETSLDNTIATTKLLMEKTRELSLINDVQSHGIAILGSRADCDSIARELFNIYLTN